MLFVKKRQRHGRNWRLWGVADRAFCKKATKARSKLEVVGCSRPCLLQKMVKGTVKIGGCGVQATVPFGKKRQRHGRNCEAEGAANRAFCKKWSKARLKSRGKGRSRPCLLQKSVKGTVEIADQWTPASRIGAFGAGRSRPDGRRLANKERSWRGAIDKCLRRQNQPSLSPKSAAVAQTSRLRRPNRSPPAAFNKIRKAPRRGASYGKKPTRTGRPPYIISTTASLGWLLTFRLKIPLFIAAVVPASHPLAYRASH